MNKILLIGCGHMGSALLQAWSKQKNFSFDVVDPVNYKKINKKYVNKIKAHKNLLDVKNLSSIDIVIFAIKPQITPSVLKQISFINFNKKTIFVSIVAGIKISFFNKFLRRYKQFIRVMPNMPAMINKGMSCLVASKSVSTRNKSKIDSLFLKVGKTLWLKKKLILM
jgi:Pyrroline-5-carboxylate reductase